MVKNTQCSKLSFYFIFSLLRGVQLASKKVSGVRCQVSGSTRRQRGNWRVTNFQSEADTGGYIINASGFSVQIIALVVIVPLPDTSFILTPET